MKLQVIQDDQGKDTGVFIPMNEWLLMKNNYPDIETIDKDVPQWEKDLIDQRLDAIAQNPKRVRPGKELLQELKRKV
ncbi:MAG: addiction module component CHP02574 family protein [Chitinophagaceae bacterium]|nr:MAG: addiction module component CHP02574 family protein [Chitinophagaceae bacterium]